MGAAVRAAPTRTRACRAADGPGGAPPVGEQRAGGRPYTAIATCGAQKVFEVGMTPEDSAHRFFEIYGGTSSGYDIPFPDSLLHFFRLNPEGDSTLARTWTPEVIRNAVEPNHVRDSVLILVDGVRRGVFSIHDPVPLKQLNLTPCDIFQFDKTRGGHWAVVLYGPDATNGVIDIKTMQVGRPLINAALQAPKSSQQQKKLEEYLAARSQGCNKP